MSDGARRLLAILAVALLASVVVAGGIWIAGSDSTTADPALDVDASDQLNSLEGITATRETVIESGGGIRRTIETVELRPRSGDVRATATATPRQTDVRVSNGSVLWLYDRDEGTVLRLDDTDGSTESLDRIPRLLAAVNTTDSTAETNPTVSPLPVVPGGSGGNATGPAGELGRYTLTYEGTEPVDGRETRVLVIQGAGGEPVANYSQQLWLDSEWYYPLKQRTAWTQGGERTVVTTTYTNVTFNPGLDDDRFTFDPPANATVETASDRTEREYDSLAALREDATMTVPAPTVPGSFTLESATWTTGRIDSLGLQYVNATSTLSVAKLDTTIPPTSEGESVTVAGQNGTYRNLGPSASVVWTCDGTQYKVRGSGLSREPLLDVADSVGCA